MAIAIALVLALSKFGLEGDLGRSKQKSKFSELFSKTREINILSIARLFLFASRDVWFVVGLPVFLSSVMVSEAIRRARTPREQTVIGLHAPFFYDG